MKGMIGKKSVGLATVFALLLIIAAPAAAAERRFNSTVPGATPEAPPRG